jgi:hypothetical protein
MFDVAGGVGCREDVAQRRGYSNRSNATHSTSPPSSHDFDVASRASSLAATGLAPTPRHSPFDFTQGRLIGGYRTGVMLYVIHV